MTNTVGKYTRLVLSGILALAVILFHSFQYLPDTPQLFLLIFVSRLLVAMACAFAICLMLECLIAGRNKRRFFNNTGTATFLVALLMVAISWTNQVSDGLIQLFTMS